MATRMKSLAPAPEAVLAAVRRAEPRLPPAQIDPADPACALNIRARASTMAAIEAVAQESGRTMKQVIMEAAKPNRTRLVEYLRRAQEAGHREPGAESRAQEAARREPGCWPAPITCQILPDTCPRGSTRRWPISEKT